MVITSSTEASCPANVLLHHGRGLSRSSALLVQTRSVWVPRGAVAPLCAAFGWGLAISSAEVLQQTTEPAAAWWYIALGPLGGLACWALCWGTLVLCRQMEDVLCEFSEDECGDRAAASGVLAGVAMLAAVGWVIGFYTTS
jgi:hypothetical protein|eukprot:COSAG01_NODE_14018_length_1506_cov_76.308458_2_plen_141_part_00